MKKLWVVLVWALLMGCEPAEELEPAQIAAVPAQLHLGQSAVGEVKNFDLQFRNTGDETLTIVGGNIQGDRNCAFGFLGPDIKKVKRNQAAFFRVWYAPQSPGSDSIAFAVGSNSETKKTIKVAVCAEAVEQVDIVDGGVGGGSNRECTLPPTDQPDCPTSK